MATVYNQRLNPELKFWKGALKEKKHWVEKMREGGKPISVFSGGSMAAFQIDSDLLFQTFGSRTVNLGLHAGMGADATIAIATTLLQPGDRLVLMTEPEVLAGGGGRLTALGSQMVLATGSRGAAFFQPCIEEQSWVSTAWQARPGLNHMSTNIGKFLMRQPSYRYDLEGVLPGGLLVTPIRVDHTLNQRAAFPLELSARGQELLLELKEWCDKKEVSVVYLMPVSYIAEKHISRQRQYNKAFLDQVAAIIPVWEEESMGVSDEAGDFSDTFGHMTQIAARARTIQLGSRHSSELMHW